MGGAGSTGRSRIEKSASTGVLTLSQMDISSWSELIKAIGGAQNIRSMSLSSNRLRRAMPPEFLQLPLWSTLTMLDISGNNLRCACVLGYDPENGKHCHQNMGKESRNGGEPRRSRSPLASPLITLSTPIGANRLEVLNISRNCLEQLPKGLCRRFPKLRKLICRGNQVPLTFPGGLVGAIGDSTALNSVDLTECGLTSFALVEGAKPAAAAGPSGAAVEVFPNLEELLLEGNLLTGTFSLVRGSPASHDTAALRFPKLKRVSLAHPKRADLLDAVEPSFYTSAPVLNSLNLKGHEKEAAIKAALSASPEYQRWQETHAAVVDKQLAGAGAADLM